MCQWKLILEAFDFLGRPRHTEVASCNSRKEANNIKKELSPLYNNGRLHKKKVRD